MWSSFPYRVRVLVLAFVFVAALPSAADFGSAFTAYQQGDYGRAYAELNQLAAQGDGDAQFMLGDLYARGEGTAPDPVKAYQWYELAAARGVPGAAAARDQLALGMSPAQVGEARVKARQWQPASPAIPEVRPPQDPTPAISTPSPGPAPAESPLAAVPDSSPAPPATAGPPPTAAPAKRSGGFFSNLARSTSSLLGGGQADRTAGVTSTIGVRGLSSNELLAAGENPAALQRMESFRVARPEATGFAGEVPLLSRSMDYMEADRPPPADGGNRTFGRP